MQVGTLSFLQIIIIKAQRWITSSVGVKEVPSEAEGIVRRQYFTLSGTEVPIPVHRGMFVVRTLYEDGRVDVAKVFIGDSDC